MFELVIRYLLLIIVFLGIYQFAYSFLKIKEEFIPIISFSCIGLLMFISGLLNIMFLMTMFIVIFSIGSLIRSIIKKKIQYHFSIGLLYFFGLVLYLTVVLKGTTLFHYDDFSHWGLVAKEIAITNRFPNFESELISFQSYPTGSAAFIYFVAKILGVSEGVFLFAQSLLLIASLTTFFSLVKHNKRLYLLVIIIATILFLMIYVTPLVLLVDTLIPVLGLAGMIIIFYRSKEKKFKSAFLEVLPVLSFLMIIKNSSIFFILINLSLFIYCLVKNNNSKKETVIISTLSFLVPYSFLFLWNKHVEYVFSSGIEAKHSMSIENYQSIFGSKSAQDIKLISDAFIKRMFDLTNTDVKIVLFLFVFMTLIVFLIKLFKSKHAVDAVNIKMCFYLIIIYILYQFSLWAMYLLSMPIEEALFLAGYTRYSYSIIIFLYGIILIYFLNYFQKKVYSTGKLKILNFFTLFSLVIGPLMIRYNVSDIGTLLLLEKSELSVRVNLNRTIAGYNIPQNESIYIYISDDSQLNKSGILKFVAKYELRSKDINIINQGTLYNTDLPKKGYLILLKNDDEINKVLKNEYNMNQNIIDLKN